MPELTLKEQEDLAKGKGTPGEGTHTAEAWVTGPRPQAEGRGLQTDGACPEAFSYLLRAAEFKVLDFGGQLYIHLF